MKITTTERTIGGQFLITSYEFYLFPVPYQICGNLMAISARSLCKAYISAKSPDNFLSCRGFKLVAGVGFEPTTFRL